MCKTVYQGEFEIRLVLKASKDAEMEELWQTLSIKNRPSLSTVTA